MLTGGRRYEIIAALLVVLAVGRVAATWPVFSQTWDEGFKTALGLAFLETGRFHPEVGDPPLGVASLAVGPWLAGIRLGPGGRAFILQGLTPATPDRILPFARVPWMKGRTLNSTMRIVVAGNMIFNDGGHYRRNLALARAGVLPFLVFGAWLVWLWAVWLFGRATAAIAVLVFTMTPEVLAHAGLATNDLPLAAMLTAAFYCLARWIDAPSRGRAIALGLALGASAAIKFTAGAFVPPVAAAFLVTAALLLPSGKARASFLRVRVLTTHGIMVGLCALALLWGAYGFSYRPSLRGVHHGWVHAIGPAGAAHDLLERIADHGVLPAPELVSGIRSTLTLASSPIPAFLLGRTSLRGWWYYFPVALAVKTPLPLLLLFVAGAGLLAADGIRRRRWADLTPVLAAMAILLVSLTFHVNIGIRYVLPFYSCAAIVAAYGATRLFASGRRPLVFVSCGLAAGLVTVSVAAHPDYLPSFNALAGRHPERILVDSNLDWGQDMLRLSAELRRRGVRHVTLACFGTADLRFLDFPSWEVLPPRTRVSGWVAASETKLAGVFESPDAFAWLRGVEPVARIGHSIRLYYLPPAGTAAAAAGPGAHFDR